MSKLTFKSIAFTATIALLLGLLIWSVGKNDPVILIQRPTSPPAAVATNTFGIPTNNWVKESPLTDEEMISFGMDLVELREVARERKKWGERIDRIVISSEDFAWIYYVKNTSAPPRAVGVNKDGNIWR